MTVPNVWFTKSMQIIFTKIKSYGAFCDGVKL